MILVVLSSAALTKIEAPNVLAGFPHEACGAAAELRQTARRRQQARQALLAASRGYHRLLHEHHVRRGD